MKKYLSLVKFSHTIFALPFALIGFFLGMYAVTTSELLYANFIGIQKFVIFFKLHGTLFLFVLLCMVTARNAAMAFNRYIDRKFDEQNPRTAIREIPSGIITPGNALFFISINVMLFVATTYFINSICFYLSPIALFVILGYSLTKRFTFLCHLILGVGLALAPIGAFLAVKGSFELLPLMFSFAVFFWVSGFDIIYALQDEQFDKENQLHSIPSYFGQSKAKWISRALHFGAITCLFVAGVFGNFVSVFWIGFFVFVLLLFYQHFLIFKYGLQKIDLAFFTTNGIASILFALCVITEIIMHL
ncbi:MAG TPA: UbiA-like polyprenyltransferase [Chitinophagales bacterium]|jgi:4-hydroxybenzoate polyprenyltransferase|nr:putative 4-hydroxybenzoate polyprenyltransferase [Chitinophagales bacterium]MBP6154379.1 putative 4-hydroxybenzoate polyprenyltransferase [Chitinophagales bacterium]HQV78796.1 UbiA-like polyprenyltransferase [Chitinophagales bacterium]HQW79162.1 UbiA-like polyprenyltransferase [Chitinophagales bacterium]